jgi:transcriptional regulator with XRE-family HTH domain
MNIQNLIDQAKTESGLSMGELAKGLGRSQSRLSEWKAGKQKPDASEIAFFAEKARLSVLETVAEIEAQLRPELAEVWKRAVSQLRQNRG